jgi:signal transduction histidine kinase/serine/threonine protein kinase/tetratricopeptide (TPR) repeat protein
MIRGESAARAEEVSIPGLEDLEPIGCGAQSIVFRARRGHQVVAVKLHRTDLPGTERRQARLRLRREAAILGSMRHPGLASINALGEIDGRPYIVMEYVRGETLAAKIARGPIDEPLVRMFARRLAGALGEIHRRGLVHRDVTPKNVIIDEAGSAKLIDLGFVTRIAAELDPNLIVGTLCYCAPEQIGVLHRPLDGRSDLYALGAVLFECASGHPPFESDDVGELLRRHAVVTPPDLSSVSPHVSSTFSAMIAKLLAKDPDDRYASADSFVADLDRYEELERSSKKGVRAPLGERTDSGSMRPQSEQTLKRPLIVGRQQEFARLLDAWHRAKTRGAVVLVEGEAGSGKTRLLEELAHRTQSDDPGLLVLSGCCSKDARAPFEPFRAALDAHLESLEQMTPELRAKAEQNLKEAALDLGACAAQLSPSLSALLGDRGRTTSEGSCDPLCDRAATLLLRLARLHGGMLLFTDDVDWLAPDAHEILARLAHRIGEAPLLLVIAARTDRVAHASQPALARSRIEQLVEELGPIVLERICLPPLKRDALRVLLSLHLGGHLLDEHTIEQIAARSNGNPQLAVEYLSAMVDAGVLWPSFGCWSVDREELDELDLPPNLIDLLRLRVSALSEDTRLVLSAAAVWGERFEVEQLVRVCGRDASIVNSALNEALAARLIDRRATDRYAFAHRRAQEALLCALDEQQVEHWHQRSAEVLELEASDSDEHVYARARHWARTARGLYPRLAYDASFAAGARALEKLAYAQAETFLEEAVQIAAAHKLDPDPSLAEALARVYSRSGDFELARTQLENALSAFDDPVRRAHVVARIGALALAGGDRSRAREEMSKAFVEVGRPLPVGAISTASLAARFRERAEQLIARAKRRLLGHGPWARDAGLLRVSFDLLDLSIQLAVADLTPRSELSRARAQQKIARQLGIREQVRSHAHIARAAAVLGKARTARRASTQALSCAEAIGDRESVAFALKNRAEVENLLGELRDAAALGKRALDELGRELDPVEHADGCVQMAWSFMVRGHAREAWASLEQAGIREEIARSAPHHAKRHLLHPVAGAVLAELGRHRASAEHFARARDLSSGAPEALDAKLCYYANLVFGYVEQGVLGSRFEDALAGFHATGVAPQRVPLSARHFYIAQAHARLAQLMEADTAGASPEDRGRKLSEALRELQSAGMSPLFQAHRDAILGMMHAHDGDRERAMEPLTRAEEIARDIDSAWILQELAAFRARLLLKGSNPSAALREARIACHIAEDSGLVARARELRSKFLLVTERSVSSFSSSDLSSVNLQRQRDALLQVSLASATITDPEAQTRIALDRIIEILHAERAFLFLSETGAEDHLELRAARDADGSDLAADAAYQGEVVETVRASRCPMIVNAPSDGSARSDGAGTRGLRSIMAAPVMKGDRLVGVIYLDTRIARGIFSEENLKILVAIANHVYVTLEATRTARLEVYRRIAANVPGALYRIIVRPDRELEVPFISNGCLELFLVEPNDILQDARRLIDALDPADRGRFLDTLLTAARSLTPWVFEGRSRKDKDPRWIKIAGRPQKLASGDIEVDGLIMDITEQKRAERALEKVVEELADTTQRERERAEALKEAHARLVEASHRLVEEQSKLIHAEKLSSIGRLAAGVAHEINNPLTGVMACVEALESFNVPEDRREQYFETINDGLERIQSVVQSLLDFAAPHKGEFVSVDVYPIVSSTIRLIQPEIMRRRIRVNVPIKSGRVWVRANRSQLMQALMNVLLNAIHASPPNAEIRVRAKLDSVRAGIEVTDQGSGIPAELLERVCEPFFTTKPQGEGTGLGLSVTLGIMEAHKGDLQIQSKVGVGTTVTLWLIAAEPPLDQRAEERPS